MPNIDVERYLEALVKAARDVLGTEVVGAYAAGSLALNAFHAGRSDIDIALLCRDPLVKGHESVPVGGQVMSLRADS